MTLNPKDQRIGQLEQTLDAMQRERDALRLIVTEKFAGADMYLKPEDAADVARWAAHPEAVRELLKAPMCHCAAAFDDLPDIHNRTCPVTAAWRAIGDPRWLADVERAHDAALREHRPGRFVPLERRPAARMLQVEALLARGLITDEMARRCLDYPAGVAGGIVTLPER